MAGLAHGKSRKEASNALSLPKGFIMWFVYIVRCSDTSLYIGMSNNVSERVRKHNDGSGARYTAQRKPVFLVHTESYPNKSDAMRRERQLKGWVRSKKENLIAFGNPYKK